MFEWKNTDPRLDINKRDQIVILRPNLNGYKIDTGYGWVDTKEGWLITTTFENKHCIGVEDDWDDSWFWIFAPKVSGKI